MNQGRTASENVTCVRWFSAQDQVELRMRFWIWVGCAGIGTFRFRGNMSVLVGFKISEMVMVFKRKLVREGKRGEQDLPGLSGLISQILLALNFFRYVGRLSKNHKSLILMLITTWFYYIRIWQKWRNYTFSTISENNNDSGHFVISNESERNWVRFQSWGSP